MSSTQEIPALLKEKGVTSALLVTDPQPRGQGITTPLEELWEQSGILCTVYDRTNANPTTLPGIHEEDIPLMAAHADREANPLYPVPVLMDQKALEQFYYKVADWSERHENY